jgi:hypothetical protein
MNSVNESIALYRKMRDQQGCFKLPIQTDFDVYWRWYYTGTFYVPTVQVYKKESELRYGYLLPVYFDNKLWPTIRTRCT